MQSDNSKQWSQFWKQGFITTFGASKPDNYDGIVRDFWYEKFAELPSSALVLDIATGNGAIATIAAEVGRKLQKNFFVAASDLAQINPELTNNDQGSALRESIYFYSNTPCEKQPFDDASFDLVCSQFGFEYSDIELTIPEVRRVLAPKGRFIAISHHVDSSLISAAREEIEVYQYALFELDLFGRLRKYFEALGDLDGNPKKLARRLEAAKPYSQAVNEGMDRFRGRYPEEESAKEIVGAISYLGRGAREKTTKQRLYALEAAAEDFGLANKRLQDMVRAALGQEQIDRLQRIGKAAGFESVICLRLFGDDSTLAGWQIHMQ